jgi:signal transduction histidine kinase
MQLELNNILLEMAASISHEVRNPMTTVRGYLQLLRKKDEKCSAFRNVFDIMIEELDRANELITEFLAIAQKRSYEIQTINLNDIIKKLFPLLQAEALMESKFIKMELDDIPKLPLNEAEIRQVIINLVKNAIDISPVNGFVKIKTENREEEKKVVLSVHDQGTGISPENMAKLGTPFFTTKENGTGLGLAVCYRIIERHQGSIEIETSPFGTVFKVIFNYE